MTSPRVVIAAPASGHGKTTVATGLLAALTARGVKAAGFKVGPDYIDPSYHAMACGRPGRNLDPVLVGEDLIVPLFRHGSTTVEVSIVEGVMGLYDGRSGQADFGSTAHVARLLDAPVILVADTSAQGRSVAALVHGFRSFGDVAFAGVVLNKVGSDRHEEILREACAEIGAPVLGALRRTEVAAVPSRHLGLIPAGERSATEAIAAMAELVSGLADGVLAVARSAPALPGAVWTPPVVERAARPVVAVAAGRAFTFGYQEQVELLEAAGAEVRRFDPLQDESLPPDTAALVVGGGFPEVYAAELSANVPLRQAIRDLAASGAPVVAECAGLLWLGRSLDGMQMCGVLDTEATMTDRLTLGYRDAVAVTDSVLAVSGTHVIGHEFHKTVVSPGVGSNPAWSWQGGTEGFVQSGVHASYLHTHWAGSPGFARRLVDAACG